jgi:hypothetical protein
MADNSIFPSILPEGEGVSREQVVEIFESDHKLIQQAAVICNEWATNQAPINGQSSKTEIIDYLVANMNERDIKTIRRKSEERLND